MKLIMNMCVAVVVAFSFTGAPNVAAYDDLRALVEDEFGDSRGGIYEDDAPPTQGKPCCVKKTVTTYPVNDNTGKISGKGTTATTVTAQNFPKPKKDGDGKTKPLNCPDGSKKDAKPKTQPGGKSATETTEEWWAAKPVIGEDGKQVKDKAGNPLYHPC